LEIRKVWEVLKVQEIWEFRNIRKVWKVQFVLEAWEGPGGPGGLKYPEVREFLEIWEIRKFQEVRKVWKARMSIKAKNWSCQLHYPWHPEFQRPCIEAFFKKFLTSFLGQINFLILGGLLYR
jgi:hypothetical protein